MLEYLAIIFTAVLANNIVFSQFLGICPFIGVSKDLQSAFGMGMAVAFVMGLATCATWILQHYILLPPAPPDNPSSPHDTPALAGGNDNSSVS